MLCPALCKAVVGRITLFFGQVLLSGHEPCLGEWNGASEAEFMGFLLLWASMQVSLEEKTAPSLHVFTWLRGPTIVDLEVGKSPSEN